MTDEPIHSLLSRPITTFSKAVGLYQTLFRRYLEHFFPDAVLDSGGDRSVIQWESGTVHVNYRIYPDPSGLGVEIEWFRTRYLLLPNSPTPFLAAEGRLIEVILNLLDRRFRSMFDPQMTQAAELFHFAVEDLIVADYLDAPNPARIPAALEALRVAALSTYENRRVSTGALLLGTDEDPAAPGQENPAGAPRYNVRLTAIKGFHRLCDGVKTLYLVDLNGELFRTIDVNRWADRVHGSEEPTSPCPRPYGGHAKATLKHRHIALVLTPSQEIKIFGAGSLAFSFADARWRLLDIPTKFETWCKAIGDSSLPDLARRIFQAGLNLSEARRGGVFVVARDSAATLSQLIAPADRIVEEIAEDDLQDPENLSPRLAKKSLHHIVRNQTVADLDAAVLESLAGIDGAVVIDRSGRLLTFGAILRIAPEVLRVARSIEGARSLAAIAASFHGPTLKVSDDGRLTMYLSGRRVWDL